MTPKFNAMITVQLEGGGTITAPMLTRQTRHVVGDRLVPSPIEVDFPGFDDAPAFRMVIEVLKGVPRCTELTLRRYPDGGREIRQKDLREIELDYWVEVFVAKVSMQIVSGEGEPIHAVVGGTEESMRRGMKVIRQARKASRRPLTADRLRRVADVYNAHDDGALEAVADHFGVSRSTAARHVRAAREAGLIEARRPQ